MDIFVAYDMTVTDLVKQFSEAFPFLRLEVFARGEEMSNAAHHCRLNEISRKKLPVSFRLSPELKVSEVEELFWTNMGLQITIFRKSGTTWLESSFTNYWSLERQNTLGKEMGNLLATEIKKV